MKTIDIEIAVMEYIGIRQHLIVPNVDWGMNLHECDILSLSKSGYTTEVEIKVSKHDLLKDKKKWHGHRNKNIAYFFFAVPEKLKLIALAHIPERAGLFVAKKYRPESFKGGGIYIDLIKPCLRNKNFVKWNDEDRYKKEGNQGVKMEKYFLKAQKIPWRLCRVWAQPWIRLARQRCIEENGNN